MNLSISGFSLTTTRKPPALPSVSGTVRKLQALGLAGLKDSPVNVGFLSQVYYDARQNYPDFEVIPGTSTGWLPFYAMGIRAMIAGMCNYAPEIITRLTRETFAGDIDCCGKNLSGHDGPEREAAFHR